MSATRRPIALSDVSPGMVVTVERDGGDRYANRVVSVLGASVAPLLAVQTLIGVWKTLESFAAAGFSVSVEVEDQEDDPIPRYAQLDVWMALYGPEFSEAYEPFRDEHGFAETWAQLLSQVRSAVAVREHDAPVVEVEETPEPTDVLEAVEAWIADPYDGVHENRVLDVDRLRAIVRGTSQTPEPPRMNGETAIASGNASGLEEPPEQTAALSGWHDPEPYLQVYASEIYRVFSRRAEGGNGAAYEPRTREQYDATLRGSEAQKIADWVRAEGAIYNIDGLAARIEHGDYK